MQAHQQHGGQHGDSWLQLHSGLSGKNSVSLFILCASLTSMVAIEVNLFTLQLCAQYTDPL